MNKRKNFPVLVFMHTPFQAYQLWSVLNMRNDKKRKEAFREFVTANPIKEWEWYTVRMVIKKLNTTSIEHFENKIKSLKKLFNELNLDNLRTLVEQLRSYESSIINKRRSDECGRIVFGDHDKARILGDELEFTYERFRPLNIAA